mmetsp:Transcript_30861/g.67531  ORF Transcript_30861/g.67531 Transcript_30861/m.67531 type:complete len:243 (-) Transcript_30861:940-1668(-)
MLLHLTPDFPYPDHILLCRSRQVFAVYVQTCGNALMFRCEDLRREDCTLQACKLKLRTFSHHNCSITAALVDQHGCCDGRGVMLEGAVHFYVNSMLMDLVNCDLLSAPEHDVRPCQTQTLDAELGLDDRACISLRVDHQHRRRGRLDCEVRRTQRGVQLRLIDNDVGSLGLQVHQTLARAPRQARDRAVAGTVHGQDLPTGLGLRRARERRAPPLHNPAISCAHSEDTLARIEVDAGDFVAS